MTNEDDQEAMEIAQVDAQADKAKQTIRSYYDMKRRGLLSPLAALRTSTIITESQKPAATRTHTTTAKTRELLGLVKKAILSHSSDEYTFPEIRNKLAKQGRKLSRDEMRRVMKLLSGKAPAYVVSERSGSIAGVYSRVPTTWEHAGQNLSASRNGHPLPAEDQT